jgi:hypothetical protein
MSQKLCARYTLGAPYLNFKRNAEKFGVRVIGRKIRYFISINDSVYEVGGGRTKKIDKRYSKSQLKENSDETPSSFRLYCTSDIICQSELYCQLHLTHFHYP